MVHDISHEKSLLLNFFSGKAFFVLNGEDEVDSFLEFINSYDSRFNKDFERKSELKSAAWVLSNLSHQYQLEWGTDISDFFGRDMEPIDYSVVRKYVEHEEKFMQQLRDLMKGSDDNRWWWVVILMLFVFAGKGWKLPDGAEDK